MLQVSRRLGGEVEIFHSLQGEGIHMGTPAVFLRLALCNLRCTWCDTSYTWDWEHYDYNQEVQSLEAERVEQEIVRHECKHLVVTGGEPTLQARQLVPLLLSLKRQGFFVEVETNGTILPGSALASLVDQWNVSPKLANSGNPIKQREVSGVYRFFTSLPNAYFKYVMEGPEDLREVRELTERYGVSPARTLLMPQAIDAATLGEKSSWLVDACEASGFRFSTRLHVLLWGAKRGV